MTAQYFIDTNVLLYAGSGANEDQAKKAIADIGFSAQVMQEFYYAAVRTMTELRLLTHSLRRLSCFNLRLLPILVHGDVDHFRFRHPHLLFR